MVLDAATVSAAGRPRLDLMSDEGTRTDSGRGVPARRHAIRLLIAEDVRVLRDTLVALFSMEEDIEVVAAMASGERIAPAATEHRPDVALLDVGLPGADGLSAAAELAECLPQCRVLLLTGLGTPDLRSRAGSVGVSGFLLKDVPAQTLIDAVRAVARGQRFTDPPPVGPAARPGTPPGQPEARPQDGTDRGPGCR
jgi:DNA-binding NarL/FixJ family response regulator